MRERLRVPLKKYKGVNWGDLCLAIGHHTIEIVGERFDKKDEKFSFVGGHRVRRFTIKKNVHFKVPEGTKLDISDVETPQL